MSNCPCCSDILLRHLSSGKLFLQCQTCKIQIPTDAAGKDVEALEFLSSQPLATPQAPVTLNV